MSTDQSKQAATDENNQLTADEKTEQEPVAGEPHDEQAASVGEAERHVSAKDHEAQQEPAQKKKQAKQSRQKKPRRRVFPIWLRLLIVLILSALALGAGLMIGYGVIGDGSPMNALKWETWQHIIDLVAKGT
ncbi:hypothetical protein GCM10028778_07660 [Barrientosiimonas marina]|uniref:DNA-directed RNA polymerase subunit beta n=1 Tax=Lentibacillus kimchii TaxID=1542911 RepID=A0ABW2UX08_9BACI